MSKEIIVPSSEADRKAIKDAIIEMSNSMVRVDGEKEHQKEILNDLAENFTIDKKHFRKMAADYHKDQFDAKVAETDDYQSLYETIMK